MHVKTRDLYIFIFEILMQSDQPLAFYWSLNVKCAFLFFDLAETKINSSKMTGPIRLKFYIQQDESQVYNA